ncbi:MAG: TonB-dependent receptor [Natronospirillum sp.]
MRVFPTVTACLLIMANSSYASERLNPLVVTGTRTEKSVVESPVKVDVLTRADLEATQPTTVAEALQRVSGLQLRNIHGREGQHVSLQGMSGDQVLVLIDGRPVTASTGSTVNLSTLSTQNIERIEIVRGATSALYGSDAMGGVVNIITRQPERPELVLRWQGRSLGDHNTDKALAGVLAEQSLGASLSWRGERWSSGTDLTYRLSAGSDRDAASYTQDTFTGSRVSVAQNLGYQWADGALLLDTSGYYTDLYRPVSQNGTAFHYTDETLQVAVGAELRQRFGALDSTTQLKSEWFDQTTTQDAVFTDAVEQRRNGVMYALFAAQQWDLQAGEHLLTLGADYRLNTLAQTQTKEALDGSTTTQIEVAEREQQSAAVYIQDDFFLSDTLEVLPGVRAQWDDGFGFFAAPKFNLRWDPDALQQAAFDGHVRAGVGVGYRVPNLKERYYFFDHAQFGYRVEGNPDLEPERNLSWQLGLNLQGERWSLDASTYLNQAQQLIVTDLDDALTAQEGLDVYRYQNVERAELMGMDIEFARQLGSAPHRLSFAYNGLRAVDSDTELALPGRTPHMVTASIDLRLHKLWQWHTSARYQSNTWSDRENTLETPAWVDLDTTLHFTPYAQSRFYLRGVNLLNQFQPINAEQDLRPLTGRQWVLGTELRLF